MVRYKSPLTESFLPTEKEDIAFWWVEKIASKYGKMARTFVRSLEDDLPDEELEELRNYLLFEVQPKLMKLFGAGKKSSNKY
jgi:hypothetical protein